MSPSWPFPFLLCLLVQASAATLACLLLSPAHLALRPCAVQPGTLPAQAGPCDLIIRMNSLMHKGLYDRIPTAGMSEGRLAGSNLFHIYPLSVDDKFSSFTEYCWFKIKCLSDSHVGVRDRQRMAQGVPHLNRSAEPIWPS